MKRILFFILFITATQFLPAQLPSWTIRLGDKTSWNFAEENKENNIVKLKTKQLSKKYNLSLAYKPAADEKEWVRTVMIDDSTGAGIIELELPEIKDVKKGKAEIRYTISNKKLKEMLANHKKVLIYFTSIPSDPAKAALVRIRPVHICTIILE